MTWTKWIISTVAGLSLSSGLVAAQSRWNFDLDFSDSGTSGDDLSVALGAVNLGAGVFGSAAVLDGGAYLASLSTGLAAPRSAFTLSAWIDVDEAQSTPDAGIAAQSNLAYGMTLHNGRIYAYVDTGGNSLFYPYRSRGGWHHVAEVFDGATISLFIDGVMVASQASTSGTTGPGSEFRVGKSYNSSALLVGSVDELFFTGTALDQAGVRSAAGLQPVAPIAVGDLLIGDVISGSILRVATDSGELIEQFVPANSGLSFPEGMAYGPDGNLYVSSSATDQVRRYDGRTGDFIDVFVVSGAGGLVDPDDLVFGPDGHLYVTANVIDRVMKFDGATGAFIADFVPSNGGGLDSPRGLAFGPDGHLYVAGLASGVVHRYDGATGAFIDDWVHAGEGGLGAPYDIAFGPDEHLYVADSTGAAVRRYDGATGTYIDDFVSPGSDGLNLPTGLAFGPDGDLYVTERFFMNSGPIPNERRVLRFDGTSGSLVDVVLSGGVLDVPFYLLFVPDTTAPTASAGPDQSIHAGQPLTLDGSGSFDDETLPGELGYSWMIVDAPSGSGATLTDAGTSAPGMTPDLPGSYEVQLVVTDQAGNQSVPDLVVVSSQNIAPTANAGADSAGVVGLATLLDGSSSSDPEEDPVSFAWTLVSAPAGSSATLDDPTIATPSLTPDLPGDYDFELVVSDGFEASLPDAVTVTAISGQEFAENTLLGAVDQVEALPPSAVTTRGNQRAFVKHLTQAIRSIQKGQLDKARMKLSKALSRTDGCVLRGEPDGSGPGRDWIVDCTAQFETHGALSIALNAISQ